MARTELVIKIPQFIYKQILKCNVSKKTIAHIFKNGTPLEKHDEEIIKETVESIWGKPPYTEVFSKIRAEIMRKDGLEEALEIIDKYTLESEDGE